MVQHLQNLKLLKEDMARKDWTICSFFFSYKNTKYIVLVKRFVGKETRKSEYALVKLHFMKAQNILDDFIVEANVSRLICEVKALREYFGIAYAENLGDIINQFSKQLGQTIPNQINDPEQVTEIEKEALVRSLSNSDSEDPNKIYCFSVKRNRDGETRTEFNSDKTKILRKNLYKVFENDLSISFCYSSEKNKEKSDSEICANFTRRCSIK